MMVSLKYFYIAVQMLVASVLFYNSSLATILGSPPIKSFEIPRDVTSQHFDMVQDKDNYIVIAYTEGVKVFDGAQWKDIKLPVNRLLRRLYYDGNNRIYIGGWNVFGYLQKDRFGQYQFTNLTPKPLEKEFNSIWYIEECQGQIFFNSLYDSFAYDLNSKKLNHWHFEAKLGAIACIDNKTILQDRNIGFKTLENGQWVLADIKTQNNDFIYFIEVLNKNLSYIHTAKNNWEIIKDNQTVPLQLAGNFLEQDNYVTGATLSETTFVLGSNNGLITFVDLNNNSAESFQLSNNWISAIVKSNNDGVLVLTEFEVFFIAWPSPWRVQSGDSGLGSEIHSLSKWNEKYYAMTSSGVFKEEITEYNNQSKSYKRLNWTNAEAWALFPIDKKQAILAESKKLFLIDDNSINPISETIYPREFFPSSYNPNIVFVRTEIGINVLNNTGTEWKVLDLYDEIALSLVELNSNNLLVSTYEKGLIQIELNSELTQSVSVTDVSKTLGRNILNSNGVGLVKHFDEKIFAISEQGIYQLQVEEFVETEINNLGSVVDISEIQQIYKSKNNKYWLTTPTKVVYQDSQNQWQLLDLTASTKGAIQGLWFDQNSVKIATMDSIFTFVESLVKSDQKSNGRLILTDVKVKAHYGDASYLPITRDETVELKVGADEVLFNFIFNDLKNQDNILYSYRLLGLDEQWSEFNKIHFISFNRLPANDYQFELKAKDTLGIIHQMTPYKFKITPKWFRSPLALFIWWSLGLLLFTFMLSKYLKWKEKQHELQKKELKKIINEKTNELKAANKRLQSMVHQDGLTNLSNRLYLEQYINHLIEKSIHQMSVIMMDMDHFKKYNDTNGHMEGDKLLKQLALCLKKVIAKGANLIARYGGEEFLVILPNKDLDFSKEKAETIRAAIENKSKGISVSIGISTSTQIFKTNQDIYQLIDQADQALYQAKSRGRNQVCVFEVEEQYQ
jgi:diguanylate cyclase (GGDEF)-like protein